MLGTYLFFLSQDIVGVILTRLQAEKSKSSHSFSNMDRRFSPKLSRPAPAPTYPPIEWVLGVHSPELQWPECEAGHLLPSNDEVKNEWGTSSHIWMACTWMTLCLNVFGTDSLTRFYWIFLCLESFQAYKTCTVDGFGGLVVSMLASGTRVCGFKPGRSCWIFRASEKSSACLPSEGKWKNLSHVPALRHVKT